MTNSKTDELEGQLLGLIFCNISDYFNSGGALRIGSSATGSLYLSLHTANPTALVTSQTTYEADYVGYARLGLARQYGYSSGQWAIDGTINSNEHWGDWLAAWGTRLDFPVVQSGSLTVTHYIIGTELSGSGKPLYYGELPTPLALTVGSHPVIIGLSAQEE